MLVVIVAAWAAEGREEDARWPLTDTILHFEPLSYDPTPVRAEHERVRRSHAGGSIRDSLQLSLEAFGRDFALDLRPSRQVFDSAVRFKVGGTESALYDRTTFYQGKVVGDSKSKVSGHVINGIFDGIIATSDEEYHVENSGKFFREPRDFHSVVYRTRDVVFPESTCAKADLMNELRKIQATAKPAKRQPERTTRLANRGSKEQTLTDHFRQKRATTINGNRFCQVLVTADHLYNEAIGGGNPEATMAEIVTTFSQVQGIFADGDFDEDGVADGIIPLIATINILDDNAPGFSAPSIGVQNLLDLWSQEDHSQFCLALLLTYRDFDNGVLGLAWVAEPPGGNRGGICEDPVRISVGIRSLNSAIVTALNFGSRQSRAVVVITISHEFGHNFGSPHDPSTTSSCSPGGSAGNFLMFPRATNGQLPNNRLFSPCSVDSIRPVLQSNSECFSNTGAFCGNGIVESGEECDCGSDEQCATDLCCMTGCMLISPFSCSASQPCCTSGCQFQDSGFECSSPTECAGPGLCSGSSGSCQSPDPRPNPPGGGRLLCNNNNSICLDGVCSGSLCQAFGLQDCQCTENEDQLCDLCCLNGEECASTFILANTGVIPAGSGQRIESGMSCNDFNGYCNTDEPPTCITVDNEDALDDLLDLFSVETLNNIRRWLSTYWYVPIAIVVVLVIIMLLLHVTYRKRLPIKQSFRDARNSIRRGHTPSEVSRQQTGGVGAGAEGRGQGPRQISRREAVNRLRHFFPTADTDTIAGVQRVSSDEGKAVKRLLELGFPLRKVPIPRA